MIAGCTQSNSSKITEPKTSNAVHSIDTLCFSRYSGSKNQDTAVVRLIIDGDKVAGDFSNIPYEKDARIGTITGVRLNGVIKGIWKYQQEGINDSIPYEFKLQGDRLLQKETRYDTKTGREFLPDTADFNVEFSMTDCQRVG